MKRHSFSAPPHLCVEKYLCPQSFKFNWQLELALATLPHWQHSPARPGQHEHTIRHEWPGPNGAAVRSGRSAASPKCQSGQRQHRKERAHDEETSHKMPMANRPDEMGYGRIPLRGNRGSGPADNPRPRPRWSAAKALVGQHAKRVDVHQRRDLAAVQLLWRGIARRSHGNGPAIDYGKSAAGWPGGDSPRILEKSQIGQNRHAVTRDA